MIHTIPKLKSVTAITHFFDLGNNFCILALQGYTSWHKPPQKQAIELKERAQALTKEWKSMQPKLTRKWVILELERLGVRKLLNGHFASHSDEINASKEVAEVSIFYCLLFCLYIRSSLILITSLGQKSISDCKWQNVLQPPSERWYR
jgi:hypothetical protein